MSNLDNETKSSIKSVSEITLSELWEKYHRKNSHKNIGKAIAESPVQTLDRSEEIFCFIFDKYGSDTEFIAEFDIQICCCLGLAGKKNIIDEETQDFVYDCFCNVMYPDAKDEANISQQESQSNDEEI